MKRYVAVTIFIFLFMLFAWVFVPIIVGSYELEKEISSLKEQLANKDCSGYETLWMNAVNRYNNYICSQEGYDHVIDWTYDKVVCGHEEVMSLPMSRDYKEVLIN